MSGEAAGWHPDPWRRSEYRWWNGERWTDQVSRGGVAHTDAAPQSPPPTRPGPAAPPPPLARPEPATPVPPPIGSAPTPRPAAPRPPRPDNDYPFGRWWAGAILFAIVWFLSYKFAGIIWI